MFDEILDQSEGAEDSSTPQLKQQHIYVHCVRNRRPEWVKSHTFFRLPGEFAPSSQHQPSSQALVSAARPAPDSSRCAGGMCSALQCPWSWFGEITIRSDSLLEAICTSCLLSLRSCEQYCEYGLRPRCERLFPILEEHNDKPYNQSKFEHFKWTVEPAREGTATLLPPLQSRLVGRAQRQRYWAKLERELELERLAALTQDDIDTKIGRSSLCNAMSLPCPTDQLPESEKNLFLAQVERVCSLLLATSSRIDWLVLCV